VAPSASAEDLLRAAEAAEQRGERERAAVLYEDVVRTAPRDRALRELLDALRGRARTLYPEQEFDAASDIAYLHVAIGEQTGDVAAIGRGMNMLGGNAYFRNRYGEARERFEEALQLAYEAGDGVLIAYNNLGMVCADLKEYAQSVLYFDRGIELAARTGDTALLAPLRANRAEPLICMDRLDAATRTLDEAEELSRRVENYTILASIHRFRSAIARIRDDFDLARRHLDEAIAIAKEHDLALEHAEALGGYSRLHRAEGNIPEARRTLDEAMERFRELGAAREIRLLEEVRETMERERVGSRELKGCRIYDSGWRFRSC
jgi:tetratricopeptide (TPR) repeat protein